MVRFSTLTIALILAACSGSPPPEPPPASASWAVVQKNLPGALFSIYAPAKDDVWAAGTDPGTGPMLLHFDGQHWHQLSTGTQGSLRWIQGFSGGPIFIGGDGGTILRSTDGKTFEKMDTPSQTKVWGVWGSAPDDVWAVGGEPEGGGFVWRYDGHSWQDVAVPDGVTSGAVFKVWGRSKSDVFMVGTSGLVLHYKGAALEKEDPGVTATLFTVNGNASSVVAVGGFASGVVVESTGDGTWHHVTVPTNGGLIGVCAASSGTFSCGEQAAILEEQRDGTWKRLPGSDLQSQDLHAITVDPSGGIWTVGGDLNGGTDGVLLHYGDKVPTGIDAG